MKNKNHDIFTNISIFDYFLIGLVTLIAQYITTILRSAFAKIIVSPLWLNKLCLYTALFLLPLILTAPFIRRAAHNHYVSSDDRWCSLKCYLRYVLPSEAVRFVLCILPLQYVFTKTQWYISLIPTNFGMAFAPFVNAVLTDTYGAITNRQYEVSNYFPYEVVLIGEDFLFYSIIHVVYLGLYLLVQYLYYRHEWNREAKTYRVWHDEMMKTKQEWEKY